MDETEKAVADEVIAQRTAEAGMGDLVEHFKLAKIQPQSQAIGEFLDTSGYVLAEWVHVDYSDHADGRPRGNAIEVCEPRDRDCRENHRDELWPRRAPLQSILAAYFGIDLVALEAEKDAMLTRVQAQMEPQ